MKQFAFSDSERVRIETLIATLTRTLSNLAADIRTEEERAGLADIASPAYPTLARHLRTRHKNLSATIAELRTRLPRQVEPDRLAC
jgi:hypothetical protein